MDYLNYLNTFLVDHEHYIIPGKNESSNPTSGIRMFPSLYFFVYTRSRRHTQTLTATCSPKMDICTDNITMLYMLILKTAVYKHTRCFNRVQFFLKLSFHSQNKANNNKTPNVKTT